MNEWRNAVNCQSIYLYWPFLPHKLILIAMRWQWQVIDENATAAPNQSGMDESVFQIWLVNNPVMTSSSQGKKGRKRPEAFYDMQTLFFVHFHFLF